MEPPKTDTLRDEQKCPSYRGVRLIEVIFNRNRPLGHLKVSVLERCPSYGMSVLRGFTVFTNNVKFTYIYKLMLTQIYLSVYLTVQRVISM